MIVTYKGVDYKCAVVDIHLVPNYQTMAYSGKGDVCRGIFTYGYPQPEHFQVV